MNGKLKLFAVLAGGLVMISAAGATSAAPNHHARCTADRAELERDIDFWAKQDHPNGPNNIGVWSKADCSGSGSS